MNKIIKDALILLAITLVAGFALGFVYEATKGPIADTQRAATLAAYQQIFPEAGEFVEVDAYSKEQAEAFVSENIPNKMSIDGVVKAMQDGTAVGYVLTVTTSEGYGGDITYSVGIKNDGTLNGYSITDISETAGLGMKAKEEKFSSQFVGKNVSALEVIKSAASSDSQIEAISGATITSKAMTYSVNGAMAYFHAFLEGGE